MTEDASRMRVLVVEDNPDGATATLLPRCGYDAPAASDGPDALRQAADVTPDVVLLDIGLPGMDGWQVARRMRQMGTLRGTYLVAVTGYGTEADFRRSADASIHFHLVKPVMPQILKRLLQGLPPHARPAAPSGDTR